MKKNRMMRLASILLVCVLLTTSVISGTFAKYTTSVSSDDKARVANWGFTTTTLDFDLFDGTYDNVAYQASSGEPTNLIAPGTEKKDAGKFKMILAEADKAPEVAYTFAITTDGSSCADEIKNNKNIIWYLDGSKATAAGKEDGSWDALIAAIEALDGDKTYAAGEFPEAFKSGATHNVGWEWLISGSSEYAVAGQEGSGTDKKLTQDEYDTYMGNQATLAQVKLVIKFTATQID